jgi:hypothetical protein
VSGRTLTVRLPFYCEPVVDQHRFGGLVDNVFVVQDSPLIKSVVVKTEHVQAVRLTQAWENDETTDKSREPYVSLTVILDSGPTPGELVWYWRGDGEYDGFSVNGEREGWWETQEE